MSEMVEKVARAIEGIQLFSRYNDFTSDAVEGLPVEVCRYCNWGEGQDGENIEVIARFPSGWEVETELPKMVTELQARAAIEAMREPTEDMLKAAKENDMKYVDETSPPEEYWPLMIDAALKD